MTVRVNFLSDELHKELEEMRREAVRSWPGYEDLKGGNWPLDLSELSASFVPPGSMWHCPWIFDPEKEADQLDLRLARARQPDYNGYLSVHYLQDHARTRPPLCVKLPNHSDWIVDQKSSNGSGWVVTYSQPDYSDITCSPSILVPGYHGFLQNGVFTPDLDNGQGPDGVPSWRLRRE